MQRPQDPASERFLELFASVARTQRSVEYITDARFPQRTCAGIERHLMRRSVEEILIGPENFLSTVAVVHVEIDDGDALGTIFFRA